MRTLFDLRLRQYTPGGARGEVIRTLTIDANPLDSDLSTVTFKVSDKVLSALPEFLEVALEYFFGNSWEEALNGRFLVNTHQVDKKDPAGIRTLTGVNYWLWKADKTSLRGVVPYSESGKSAARDPGITGATSSGTTVTKTAHGFINGDAILMTGKNRKMATLVPKVIYYVGSATTNTFKVLGSRNGGARKLGTWTGINFRRVNDKIASPGSQFRENDLVTFTNVSTSPTLRTDTSYRVVQKDANGFGVSSQVGGDPIDIVENSGSNVVGLALYRELDGDRQLAGTPGTILKTVIDEAQARGWSPELSYDFATTTDSSGAAWATSTPLQFPPGTSVRAILTRLVEMGMCDYSTDGRVLHLWNPEHGTNRSLGANPVRVGMTAQAVPTKLSLDNLVTDLTVQGEGAVLVDLHSATAPTNLGRLEQYESLSGVMDKATASLLGSNTLKLGSQIQRQYTVTEKSPTVLPGVHYWSGDWVQARIGDTWVSLRVVELVLSKDSTGISVSLVLNSRFIELLARLARKRAAATGGVSVGGNGTTRPGQDKRLPAAPTNLTLGSDAGWMGGKATTAITASWSPVTQATDATAIDIDTYQVCIRRDGEVTSSAVGETRGLSLSKGPYEVGVDYYVKVRARSSAGVWGRFSDEVEMTTTAVLDPLDPPTAPTVTSKLGTVKVSWDGMLEGDDGPYFPPAEFAGVYAVMSTDEAGLYSPVASNMGNAGAVTVTGLSLGDVRWFQFYAIDSMGIASPPSAATSVTVVGVKGPDLEANSVTANAIDVGAVHAEHIALGTNLPNGNPVNRVPAPVTDSVFWAKVIDGTIQMSALVQGNVAATPSGVTATVGSVRSSIGLTTMLPIPASRKVALTYVQTVAGGLMVFHYAANGTYVSGAGVTTMLVGTETFEAPAGATQYRVTLLRDPTDLPTTAMVQALQVFEVIGGGSTDQQSAEISPAGVRLISADGSTAVDMTTNTDQVLSVSKFTGLGYEALATIDSDGGGFFQTLSVTNDISVQGDDLVGGFGDREVNGGALTIPLLDRPGGVIVGIADVGRLKGSGADDRIVTSAISQALLAAQVTLEAGRRYRFDLTGQLEAWWNEDSPATNLLLELWSGTVQQNVGSPNGSRLGVWKILDTSAPVGLRVQNAIPSIPPTNLTGTRYLLLRVISSAGTARSYTLLDPDDNDPNNPTLVITDAGPDSDYADLGNTLTRASSGTPSAPGGTTTKTWTCSWSRSWRANGSEIISGSSQYFDANMLYQGYGSTPEGSRFGIPAAVASTLAGKTIKSCQIWLQNRHFAAYSGGVARLGTGGNTSAPSTFGSRSNGWDVSWGRGEGKWVSVPSARWSAILSGSIRDFSLGISGTVADYAYFDGLGKSSPPKIKISYR